MGSSAKQLKRPLNFHKGLSICLWNNLYNWKTKAVLKVMIGCLLAYIFKWFISTDLY